VKKVPEIEVPTHVTITKKEDGSITYRVTYGEVKPIVLKDGTKVRLKFTSEEQCIAP
jgi:hypothetical protein